MTNERKLQARHITQVRLREDQFDWIERFQAATRESKSEVIRRVVDAAMATDVSVLEGARDAEQLLDEQHPGWREKS